jgi:neutral ceramidase
MASGGYEISGLPSVRAGAAQRVITPALGCGLAGYFHERIARSVRDDLYCHALVLESGGARLALISCDLVALDADMVVTIKAAIQAETGITPDRVLVHCTHTHTGPVVVGTGAGLPLDATYVGALPGLVAATVAQAVAGRFDALLFPGRREEDHVGSNRLGRCRDGSEVFGKAGVLGPAGPIDPEVLALGVRDLSGRLRAAVVNYAMHPDVIGGGSADFLSADWPGEVGRALAAVYGPDVVTVFLNGTCGDLNHGQWDPTRIPTGGPAKAVQMGRTLAGAAMAAIETAEPLETARIGAAGRTLDIPYYTRDAAFLAEAAAARAKPQSARQGWEQALVLMDDHWDHDGETAHLPLQVLRLGDVLFVGLPGEVFVKWGLEIKHWSPARYTFVAELANGWFGYIPTTDQAHRGAYGARPVLSRQLVADGGRQLTDAVQVLMWQIWGA